ncbi:MAG: PAS domain-containing protein [Thermomicrobiales bacterium]
MSEPDRIVPRVGLDDGGQPAADLFASAFQHALIGMAVTANDGAILDVNPALCRMLGHGRDDLLGRTIIEFTHPLERHALAGRLASLARRESSSVQTDWRFIVHDDVIGWARLSMSAACSSEECGKHLVIQAQDITAEQAAETARRDAERRFRAFIE